jgi:hypothetical protein
VPGQRRRSPSAVASFGGGGGVAKAVFVQHWIVKFFFDFFPTIWPFFVFGLYINKTLIFLVFLSAVALVFYLMSLEHNFLQV